MPKDKRHKKCEPGMAEEKAAQNGSEIKTVCRIQRKGAEVRQRNKSRAGEIKERDGVERKRYALGMRGDERRAGEDEKCGAVDEELVYVEHGRVGQHDIGHEIAGTLGRIPDGVKHRNKTRRE